MNLQTIGIIQSPFIDKFGTPRQSQIAKHTLSTLVLDRQKYPSEMLDGLQIGTFIWVIFGFHLNQSKKPLIKVHPPRLRGKKMGVFATRSPHRPNPLGLSLAKIEELKKNQIVLSGLDLVDQTPVYDIKPYLPIFDRPRGKQNLWMTEIPFPKLRVRFSKNALKETESSKKVLFKKQLREILSEDPRPLAYLQKSDHLYWLRYGELDVGFEVSKSTLTVVQIRSVND